MKAKAELPWVLALDPGNEKTGWVYGLLDDEHEYGFSEVRFGITENAELRKAMRLGHYNIKQTRLVIETPRPRGMPTAGEEMETLIMIGRFIQEWSRCGGMWSMAFRGDVKLHVTGSSRAKDPHIAQAIRDHFGGEQKPLKCEHCHGKGWVGRGRPTCPACGGQKYTRPPGPIFGMASHMYPAMAVALWWKDFRHVQQRIINPGGRDKRAAKTVKPKERRRTPKTSRILR